MTEAGDREAFQKLKVFCVPLLKHSELTHAAIPTVLSLLSDLDNALDELERQNYALPPALSSYAAFPLLSLIRRNTMSSIPDRVLELVFLCLRSICGSWWWTLDVATWEQLFMLCGSVIGGVNGNGKAKARDDETRTAAVRCLNALTRPREEDEGAAASLVLEKYTVRTRDPKFAPIIGQTLDSLLSCTSSAHRPLKLACLQALGFLLDIYAPDDFTPVVLPGVMSSMTRLVLGTSSSKGWENGDLVAEGLRVAQVTIIRAIGDDVCLRAGAVKDATSLDDLAAFTEGAEEEHFTTGPGTPRTARTPTWLRGTSTQLHIALNTLTPLVSHPNSAALIAFATFSSGIISSTTLTLPASQPLLASFLLSLSASSYDSVATFSAQRLRELLTPQCKARHSLLQTLVQITRDNLSAIPRLLLSHADAKVEHVANQIEAIGRLASGPTSDPTFGVISAGIGKLLGPTGGVERWAWRLLSALEFAPPAIVVSDTTMAQLLLEADAPANTLLHFPELEMIHIATRTTQTALERMFIALGGAAGEDALFTIEWFVSLGRQPDSRGIAALWCASRVLEGMADVRLSHPETSRARHTRNLEKATRGLVSSLSEIWEMAESDIETRPAQGPHERLEEDSSVEHSRGVIALEKTLGVLKHTLPDQERAPTRRPMLHRAVALQTLCVCAGILQARFTPMLLRALYPVLHSIVSPISFLSTTGLAALDYIAAVASYASPANMLLSNFDYALDAVSRRLSREHLDLDAMKVLVLLVRLVGPDIVHRAGDLVEECFSRLDEYHGYSIIVDGLVEVLGEVVKVIEQNEEAHIVRDPHLSAPVRLPPEDASRVDAFVQWFNTRNDPVAVDDTDYGPAPRQAWGPAEEEGHAEAEPDDNGPIDVEKLPTPLQALTKQIVSRSIYFLTHQSPLIRARILSLLASAVPVLPESALLPSINNAWPFILNRFSDTEPFVMSGAAALVEALALNVGSFMYRRVWDDVWPIFRRMLKTLETSDMQNALTRRGVERAGVESVYAHSFRLYRAMLKTMTASAQHVQVQDDLTWEVLLAFRRFLHREAHEELQKAAVELYSAIAKNNEDAVWLALVSTTSRGDRRMSFLRRDDWDIEANVQLFLGSV
ncbi:ARM repeat-containing protein [Peniophora sp. CONT]|nr:ARM repeat-containing protein [Peniophora sp. CONT]